MHGITQILLAGLLSFLPLATPGDDYAQKETDLLEGEPMAVAYSGFRAGQHPDRGNGATNPSREQTLEDLRILTEHGFGLIRLYDSGENSKLVLEVIRDEKLPIKVALGMWLEAEVSNHEKCSWLNEPIPTAKLEANKRTNASEIARGIALAKSFPQTVAAVNVGNEALVEWNDHMVPLTAMLTYVRRVKASIDQPVTVADNYNWWIQHGAPLAAELDFIGIHTYPLWENRTIDEALAYTIDNVRRVHRALPKSRIVIYEAGWASTAAEFGDRASEAHQARYYREMEKWATSSNTTVFFFEAFDEPWKGDPNNALGAEKHWGLWFLDRTPKAVMKEAR